MICSVLKKNSKYQPFRCTRNWLKVQSLKLQKKLPENCTIGETVLSKVIFVPKKCSNLVGNSSSDRDFKLTFETQVILLWQKPVRQQPRRKSGKADNIEVPSTVVGLVAMQMANSLQCNCTLGKVKCHKNSHFQNGRKHWCRVLFSRRFVTFHQACSKKMNIYVHNIAKFLTFPPKWISFLQVLPLIFFCPVQVTIRQTPSPS